MMYDYRCTECNSEITIERSIHDELLALLNAKSDSDEVHALRAVVELHKPYEGKDCNHCFGLHGMGETYPCPTIQAIKKELK